MIKFIYLVDVGGYKPLAVGDYDLAIDLAKYFHLYNEDDEDDFERFIKRCPYII